MDVGELLDEGHGRVAGLGAGEGVRREGRCAAWAERSRPLVQGSLGDLKAKILGSIGIDETLRLWPAGQLGNKTFQQIQEEFVELVIPKVWLNTGRNVSLVSQKLNISPKKVRRILRNTKQMGTP